MKEENIQLVDFSTSGRPVNSDISFALSLLGARDNIRKGRRLYFYYAGHGLGPTFNDIAMVPADAGRGMLNYTCFGLNQCIDFFINTGFFDELVVFMDCCREREAIPTIPLPFMFNGRFAKACPTVNYFTLLASGDGAKSFEVVDLGAAESNYRGLMTQALLEGLNGAAGAIDSSNNVTSTSLAHYVGKRVDQLAAKNQLPQSIDPPKAARPEILFLKIPDNQIPNVAMKFIAGPGSAGKQVMMLNMRTGIQQTKQAGAVGESIAFILEGNSRHQLIIPDLQPLVIDLAEVGKDPADVRLP